MKASVNREGSWQLAKEGSKQTYLILWHVCCWSSWLRVLSLVCLGVGRLQKTLVSKHTQIHKERGVMTIARLRGTIRIKPVIRLRAHGRLLMAGIIALIKLDKCALGGYPQVVSGITVHLQGQCAPAGSILTINGTISPIQEPCKKGGNTLAEIGTVFLPRVSCKPGGSIAEVLGITLPHQVLWLRVGAL